MDIARKTGFPVNLVAAQMQRSGLSNKASRLSFARKHGWEPPPLVVKDYSPFDALAVRGPLKQRAARMRRKLPFTGLQALLRAIEALEHPALRYP